MGFIYTPNVGLAKPELSEPGANWWTKINENFDKLDKLGPLGGGDYTAGSMVFAGVGGVMSQDNSNLFWDNTNKALQIKQFEFRSHFTSYLALVNKGYTGDNGTRFYILPKGAITTGTGGALKIFGDPYHTDDTQYRDIGLYFSANQGGDTGNHETGVFWLNSKATGTPYNQKNPDIGFSFQDGAVIGGRFVYKYSGAHYACFVLGGGASTIFNTYPTTIVGEFRGDVAFTNNKMLRWLNAGGTSAASGFKYNSSNELEIFAEGASRGKFTANGFVANAFMFARTTGTAGDTTPTVAGISFLQIPSNAGAYTVTNFLNSTEGQELTILFSDGNCTIENNADIGLAGAVNFTGTNADILTLIKGASKWYEKSRSVN